MRAFSLTVVGVLGLVPGCFDADVGDAALACNEAADCPAPLFCDGGRCQRGSAGDVTAPGITGGSAHLDAAVIRPGGSTTLTFAPTETLAETPRFAGSQLRFGDAAVVDGAFSVLITAEGDADEGNHDVDVGLVDLAGNRADAVYVATVVVDATPPSVVTSRLPATVATDEALVVGATANEPLASATCTFAPVFGSGDDRSVDATIDDTDLACDGGSFDASATAVQVRVTLTDLAGNRVDVDLGSVAIAFLP